MNALPGSKLPITEIERYVISHAESSHGFFIKNGKKYSVMALSKSDRNSITPENKPVDLKCTRSWDISAIKFYAPSRYLISWDGCFEKKPIKLNQPIILISDPVSMEYFIYNPDTQPKIDYIYIQLPDANASNIDLGKKLLITNLTSKNVSFMTPARKSSLADEIWITKNESVLLAIEGTHKKRIWKVHGQTSLIKATLDSNPLLRESGPIIYFAGDDKKHGIQDYLNDGELNLTLPVMEKLLQKKITHNDYMEFRWGCFSNKEQLSTFLEDIKQVDDTNINAAFIYEDDYMNHSIAVGLSIRNDQVNGYFHETLGAYSDVSCQIRKSLGKIIRTAFKHKEICIICTEEQFQTDFSSCGVMAIKFIKTYSCRSHLIDYLCTHGPLTPLTDEPDFYSIPISALPAVMLKMTQAPDMLTDTQLNTPVNRAGTSLKNYLECWKATNIGACTENVATIGKRYKYIYQFLECIGELDEDRKDMLKVIPANINSQDHNCTEKETTSIIINSNKTDSAVNTLINQDCITNKQDSSSQLHDNSAPILYTESSFPENSMKRKQLKYSPTQTSNDGIQFLDTCPSLPKIARTINVVEPMLNTKLTLGFMMPDFLLKLLGDDKNYGKIISWENKKEGVFKVHDSKTLADMWGQRRKNMSMSFHKMSQVMQQYYDKGILIKDKRRLYYRFATDDHANIKWRNSIVPTRAKKSKAQPIDIVAITDNNQPGTSNHSNVPTTIQSVLFDS